MLDEAPNHLLTRANRTFDVRLGAASAQSLNSRQARTGKVETGHSTRIKLGHQYASIPSHRISRSGRA